MDWITEHIAIGNYMEAQDIRVLRQFSSVLGLVPTLDDLRARKRQAIRELREAYELMEWELSEQTFADLLAELADKPIESIELIDGPGNDPRAFHRAVDRLAQLVKEAPPVLVHCHAGRSRSPIVVAGYLMKAQGLDADAALEFVRTKRDTYVHEALVFLLESLP